MYHPHATASAEASVSVGGYAPYYTYVHAHPSKEKEPQRAHPPKQSSSCYFRDPFDKSLIKTAKGGVFQDSRARIYTVNDKCELGTPRMCCYADRPSGMRICSATGGRLVTRSGTVYKVGNDCSLKRLD